jgi:hypothetical protein
MKKKEYNWHLPLEWRRNLAHALLNLEANEVHKPYGKDTDWYTGNKDRFITRHRKAIAFLRDVLSQQYDTQDKPRSV